jgi:hypothetical protein
MVFSVAALPTPSIALPQGSVDLRTGQPAEVRAARPGGQPAENHAEHGSSRVEGRTLGIPTAGGFLADFLRYQH